MALDPGEVRLFIEAEDVDPGLWAQLAALNHPAQALRTGSLWNGEAYQLDLSGRSFSVDPGAGAITARDDGKVNFQEALVLLSYLSGTGPGGLAGERISFLNLPGGALFFAKTHTLATDELAGDLNLTAAQFAEMGRRLGASNTGQGEASWLIWALPQIPMEAFFFSGDDDFEPKITLLVDAGADRYLALDGLWAVVNLLDRNLRRIHKELY